MGADGEVSLYRKKEVREIDEKYEDIKFYKLFAQYSTVIINKVEYYSTYWDTEHHDLYSFNNNYSKKECEELEKRYASALECSWTVWT